MSIPLARIKERTTEVLTVGPGVVVFGADEVALVATRAVQAPQRRARVCAHREGADPLHEMIIALHRETYIRPHKHLGKSESFHVIDGLVDVVLFDDVGAILRILSIGAYGSGRPFYYRLSDPVFHTLVVRSEVLVMHETTNGPFRRDDAVFAPWAPSGDDAGSARIFMRDLLAATDAALRTSR